MLRQASPARPAGGQAFATLLALIFTALCLWYYAPMLPGADLWQYDEWYTAERSQSILIRHDWLTLYSNGEPVFKKPPLQYWTSALLMWAGAPDLAALRLPSVLSAVVLAGLTFRLGGTLAGGNRWAGLAALVLMTGSTLFWVSATSAMLDMLAAALLLGAVMATGAAWQRPRLWWLVAVLVGLGALQKAPLALPVVGITGIALWVRQGGPRLTDRFAGKHLAGALVLMFALILLWPALQWGLHGGRTLRIALVQEVTNRFAPSLDGWERKIRWLVWVWVDGWLLWVAMIGAALSSFRLSRAALAPAVSLFALAFLTLLTTARGEVFDRYLIQLIPFGAAACGAALVLLFRPPLALALAALVSITAGGPFKPATDLGLTGPGMAVYRPFLTDLRLAIQPDETLIVCGWGQSDLTLYPGALWLMGSRDKPFRRIWSAQELPDALASGNIRPPLRGLCFDDEFAAMSKLQTGLVRVDQAQGFVHWTYRP